MDCISRILVGLLFMVYARINEVDTRSLISNNIQYDFNSYDHNNFLPSRHENGFEVQAGVKQGSTLVKSISESHKNDDFLFVDNDIIDLYSNADNAYDDLSDSDIKKEDDAEEWNTPTHTGTVAPQITTSKNIAFNIDDKDIEFSGIGSGSGDGTYEELSTLFTSSPSNRNYKKEFNINDKMSTNNKINSNGNNIKEKVNENDNEPQISVSGGKESFQKIHSEIKVDEAIKYNLFISDDEDYEFSGSGDDRDEQEITTHTTRQVVVSNRNDKDYDSTGSGDENIDSTYSPTDKEKLHLRGVTTTLPTAVTRLKDSFKNDTIPSIVHLLVNPSEVTTQSVVSKRDDEDYELSGSGDENGDKNFSNFIYSVTNDKVKMRIQNNTTGVPFEMTHLEKFVHNGNTANHKVESTIKDKETTDSLNTYSHEISTEVHIEKNDDEDYEMSGSGDENDANSLDFTNNNSFHKAKNSSEDDPPEITTQMYILEDVVSNNDDEDYEFSGNGDENSDSITDNQSKSIFFYTTISTASVKTFDKNLQNTSRSNDNNIKYEEITNSLESISSEITTQKYNSINVISESDESDELSSGDGDEKYSFSGNSDENRDKNDADLYLDRIFENSNNFSQTNKYEITTEMYTFENDDVDYEFSLDSDSINVNKAKSNFSYTTISPSIVNNFGKYPQNISSSNGNDTKYNELINSLETNSPKITTQKHISYTVTAESHNEDNELSGSGDEEYDLSGSGDENRD